MNIGELHSRKLKGFIAEDEAARLHDLAKEAALLGPCLEIGSYCGRSSAYLGSGCRESGGVLFSIDHHRGSEEQQPGQEYHDPELLDPATGRIDTLPHFRRVLSELSLEETVVPIVARSLTVARYWATPLGLVFIDGGHTFEAAFADYSSWVPHLMPGGYLLIHDIFPDPSKGGQAPRCIYELALASGLFTEHPMTGTLGILQRVPHGRPSGQAQRHWTKLHR